MARSIRLEWISLLYLVLFVFAILSPRIVSRGFFGLDEVQIEEFLIFALGIAGLATFSLYERVMERREEERDKAVGERDKARQELVSSYQYIGEMNRQVEALKRLANETAASLISEDRGRKEIFQSLAASAAAHVRAQDGAIRVVALDRLRTVNEYAIGDIPVRVPNKDLLQTHEEKRPYCFIRGEDGRDTLVIPSDREEPGSKVFILLPMNSNTRPEIDAGLLKVYANQAEVLHRMLSRKEVVVSS